MKKVYVVTSGEYIDYHIIKVYLNEIKAKAFVEFYNENSSYDKAQVEEYYVGKDHKRELNFYSFVYEDGRIETSFSSYPSQNQECKYYENGMRGSSWRAYGETKEKAEKNACDFKAKWLAEQAGI